MGVPRVMALIGSGETAPRMARGHRMLVDRIRRSAVASGESGAVRAAIIDTPYRFQENAADLSAELLDYFGRRIGMDVEIAAYGRADEDVVARESALECIRRADFVFSGPGSPSYALRQWLQSAIPGVLSGKLATGGVLVFASAAALTMGRATVPVYEIYKAGADPYWLDGLNVLGAIGINAAIVPHFDNGEGSGHDTRFCFLGERRLRQLEEQMPDDAYVLGIDEHTALTIDLDAERAQVHGRGRVTVRERGTSTEYPAGSEMPIDELRRSTTTGPPVAARQDEAGATNLAQRVVQLERALATEESRTALLGPALTALLDARTAARAQRDFATADAIRDRLTALGIVLTDSADGKTRYRLPD